MCRAPHHPAPHTGDCTTTQGRTGVVIGSYMLFSGLYANAGLSPKRMAAQSLQYFLSRRGEGVTYPSQKRYVEYFAEMLPVMRKQLATNDTPLPGVLPKDEGVTAGDDAAGAAAGAGTATTTTGAGAGAGAGAGSPAASSTGPSSAGADSRVSPLKYWQFLGGIMADKQSQHVFGAAALSRRSRGESLSRAASGRSRGPSEPRTRSAAPLTDGAGSEYLRNAFRRIKGVSTVVDGVWALAGARVVGCDPMPACRRSRSATCPYPLRASSCSQPSS